MIPKTVSGVTWLPRTLLRLSYCMCDSQSIPSTVRALPQKIVGYHHFTSALLDPVTFFKQVNIGDCGRNFGRLGWGPDQDSLRAIEMTWLLMNKGMPLGYLPKELKGNVRAVENAIYRLVDLNWIFG
jgi:hypothetical protein